MGVSSRTPSWLQTAGRKYHRNRERGAKDGGREWEEGHTNSGKWESRRQAGIIAALESVRQRYSWARLRDFPLRFVSHTHAAWQSVKGTVCLQVYFSGGFLPPTFKFSAEIGCVEVTVDVRRRASEEKLNMFTEKKGEHSHHEDDCH